MAAASYIQDVDRPLSPPFPNGVCGGTVVTIPKDYGLYGQNNNNNFFDINLLNPLSSFENVVLPPRDIKVWLPEQYHLPDYRYHHFPVLYCHDGQNAYEDKDSWTGSSWRMIGALSRMHERSMLEIETPPIVVCLPCAEGNILPGISRRHSEYGDYTNPISQAHSEFVAEKLHPVIMDRFRVKKGPEHTTTIGSSLGGQASLQLLLRYPDLFGAAACLSPAFQPATIAAMTANLDTLRSKRLYIDNGGDVSDTRVQLFDLHDHFTLNEKFWNPGYWWLDTQLQPMIDATLFILDQGNVSYNYWKEPGGRHNERGWAQRIHRPLKALFGKGNDDIA